MCKQMECFTPRRPKRGIFARHDAMDDANGVVRSPRLAAVKLCDCQHKNAATTFDSDAAVGDTIVVVGANRGRPENDMK